MRTLRLGVWTGSGVGVSLGPGVAVAPGVDDGVAEGVTLGDGDSGAAATLPNAINVIKTASSTFFVMSSGVETSLIVRKEAREHRKIPRLRPE